MASATNFRNRPSRSENSQVYLDLNDVDEQAPDSTSPRWSLGDLRPNALSLQQSGNPELSPDLLFAELNLLKARVAELSELARLQLHVVPFEQSGENGTRPCVSTPIIQYDHASNQDRPSIIFEDDITWALKDRPMIDDGIPTATANSSQQMPLPDSDYLLNGCTDDDLSAFMFEYGASSGNFQSPCAPNHSTGMYSSSAGLIDGNGFESVNYMTNLGSLVAPVGNLGFDTQVDAQTTLGHLPAHNNASFAVPAFVTCNDFSLAAGSANAESEAVTAPRFNCAGCGRVFGRRGDRDRHARKHDPHAIRHHCPAQGCRMSSLRKDKVMDHQRRRKH